MRGRRNPNPSQTLRPGDWYGLSSWRRRRAHQLQLEPLCAACELEGRVTPATIAHHNPPHNDDWNAFRLGPIESLCSACHEKIHGRSRDYSTAVDERGYPVDPAHPFNRRR
jgi:hypothetical protein